MAERQWTAQQLAAIENRKGTMLVSAAAGSGKTAVLVERALRLVVEDGVEIDRLLIVTFTNAAAAELKARLNEGLEKLQANANGEQRQWLRRQKMLLQRASICTADAFCLELVRQNFFRLNLPADIAVGDSGQLSTLCRQTLEIVQEEFASNESFAAFAGMYGKSKDDSSAGITLLELYRFLSTQPDKKLLREKMMQQWESQLPIEQTVWGSCIMQELKTLTEQLNQTTEKLLALPVPPVEKWTEEKWQTLKDAIESQTTAIENSIQDGWDAVRIAVKTFKIPVTRPALPASTQYTYLRNRIKEIVAEMESLMPCTAQEDLQDRAVAAPVIQAVLQAEERFEELFFASKKERKVLEFSDVEQLALELLWDSEHQTRTEFAAETAKRFHTVMVDEYQDTNALQGRLYECVASRQQDNLFFVGDVKQSIYRFRHAAPEMFQEKRRNYTEFDGIHFPTALALNANFRSLPNVLNGVNYFFSVLMSSHVGEVVYNQSEWLNCGLEQAGLNPPAGSPVLLDLVTLEEKEKDKDALQVAARIHKLVQEKFEVRGKDGTRPVEYSDFCLLLRTKSDFELYVKALSSWGIPSCVDVGADLLQVPEVQPIASLLRALDRPSDDVQLAAVLTGPIAGFGMELLVQLRLVQKKGSLYSTLLAWKKAFDAKEEQANAVSPETAQRLNRFLELFHQLRTKSTSMEGGKLCELILQQTDWAQAVGSSAVGAQRRQRIEEFLNWTQGAGKNGLPALVKALEDASNSPEGIPQKQMGTTEGCVSIMTVHRSKGLEFPVVILADCFHQFNLVDSRKPFAMHPKYGAAMQLPGVAGKYDTAAMVWMRKVLRREMLSEEMRVLYVALTRAKDLLCIVGTAGNQTKWESKWKEIAEQAENGLSPLILEKKNSFGDWILAAAIRHPDAEQLRNQVFEAGSSAFLLQPNYNSKLKISTCYSHQEEPPQPQENEQSQEKNEQLWEKIQQQFEWQDPLADLAQVESKVSVSQIAHKDADFGWEPCKPAFAQTHATITGAQRGTAAHRFLQLAKLELFQDSPAQALESELHRMVEQRLMDAESAEVLNKSKLLAFFKSDLYHRMLQAMQPPAKLLREFAFITSVSAQTVAKQQGNYQDAKVLLQGVADAVLVFPDHGELIDYKTDYAPNIQVLQERYKLQLQYYKTAIEKRIGVPITKCSIYSLHFNQEIMVSDFE